MSTPSHPPRRRPPGIRRPRVAGRAPSRTVRETGGFDLFTPAGEEPIDAAVEAEPTDQHVELPRGGPADEPTDRGVELPAFRAVAGPADEPTDRGVELPAFRAVAGPADEPTDRGIDLPAFGTVAPSADEPMDRHVDLPSVDESPDRYVELAGPVGEPTGARARRRPSEDASGIGRPDGGRSAWGEPPLATDAEQARVPAEDSIGQEPAGTGRDESGRRGAPDGDAAPVRERVAHGSWASRLRQPSGVVSDERAADGVAERPTGKRARPEPRTARSRSSRRLPTWALGAVAVVLVAAAALFGFEAAQLRGAPSARNTALIDVGATAQVSQQVTDALTKIYSFDYTRLDQNEATARSVITPAFDAQFTTLFKQVRQLAPAQKAVVTATVTMSGVRSIDGDTAQVLVFLDQQATRAAGGGQPQQLAAAGRLSVTAQRVDGVWKIAGVTPQ